MTAAQTAPVVPRRRRLRLAVPPAIWICVGVAIVNAAVWAYLTPAFQGPDESVHAAYGQYLAETGSAPPRTKSLFSPSPDEAVAFAGVPWSIAGKPNWSVARNRSLERELARTRARAARGGAGYVASYPPLYYAFEALPYYAGGNFLDRLFAMRLGSALLAGITCAFVFLFLRELLPRTPWAWTVGTLAVALQPVFGFIAGTVNPDNLLWTASAALFYLLARAFRRGLTLRLGLGMAVAVAVGTLSKPSMLPLLPGALFGLGVLVWRMRRRAMIGAAALAAGLGVPGIAASLAGGGLWHRIGGPVDVNAGGTLSTHVSLRELASYVWQFYLPRLPWMTRQFPSRNPALPRYPSYPLWQTYFEGFVGRFGWFQYGFPLWFNELGLALAVVLVALAGAALWASRAVVRLRLGELATYAIMALGLALALNVIGYEHRLVYHSNFEQSRYLFPLLPLYGALVALAARGAGRRRGPVLAAVLVVLLAGHSIAAQLLTIGRYYA